MSEQKKPQAGEWWEVDQKHNRYRCFVIGYKRDGVAVVEDSDGDIVSIDFSERKWQHLPDCTGFDWQSETFPQWYINGTDVWPLTSYVKRTSYSEYEMYNLDGTFYRPEMWQEAEQNFVLLGKWKQVTQAEAEARVEKPLPPLPETSQREYVRLWLAWGNCRVYASTTMSDDPKDREIKHDGKGFYLEGGK